MSERACLCIGKVKGDFFVKMRVLLCLSFLRRFFFCFGFHSNYELAGVLGTDKIGINNAAI